MNTEQQDGVYACRDVVQTWLKFNEGSMIEVTRESLERFERMLSRALGEDV